MKVSVIITSFNYGLYIERAVRSCLSQNMSANLFEVIVVDDASTDDSVAHIERFSRLPNFHLIVNKSNLGVAESANVGIKAALGQYVIRVDADDYVNKNMVPFMCEYLEANHDVLGVACDYVLVDDHENVVERCYADQAPVSCGIMYRRDLLVKAGLYNPEFRHCEEKELRARLGAYYKLHYLHIPFYRYRKHGKNKTTDVAALDQFDSRIRSMHNPDSN